MPVDKEAKKALEIEIRKVERRIDRLRTKRGSDNALYWAHTHANSPLVVRSELLDQDPTLLASLNCVVDQRTGEGRPGRRNDLITKQCPTEWKGLDYPAPTWEMFLRDIFEGNEELIGYVQRLLGYGITGLSDEHVFPIFWGCGRNGKSTLVEVLSYVLGPYAGPIQSDLLMDQGRYRRASSAPSPDIMALKGLRIAFASESDEGRRISPARVKWLTGGDTLIGRNPHDKYEVHFKPSHLLILLTNHKPQAPADDFAFWQRVHLVPFTVQFVDREPQTKDERPADKALPQKLKAEDSGILAWHVRGCLKYQEMGLKPPVIVREATAEYRRDEDILSDFTDECCFLEAYYKESASGLYDRYANWYEQNVSKRVPSQSAFAR